MNLKRIIIIILITLIFASILFGSLGNFFHEIRGIVSEAKSEFVDNSNDLESNSNYYDNVVFAITTADGTVSYVMLARMTIRAGDNFGPDTKDTKAIAELYYPTTNNYSDFEMIATIVKKDGTFKTQKINVDNNANNDGGKGLYMCGYSVDVNQATDEGVYFTVLYKGALNGQKYGGTFSGSGKGVYYDIEKRTTIYNKK